MKVCHAAIVVALLGITTHPLRAEAPPQMPAPVAQHAWLDQFVGEWETEGEMYPEPGQPPIRSKGTETVEKIGGFWIVGNGEFEVMGETVRSVLTVGYSPEKEKYVGTWIDSMTSMLWQYEGTVDASGKKLALFADGPCPREPGKTIRFEDSTEFKSKDHRVFTAKIQNDEGGWDTLMVVHYRRKK